MCDKRHRFAFHSVYQEFSKFEGYFVNIKLLSYKEKAFSMKLKKQYFPNRLSIVRKHIKTKIKMFANIQNSDS